MRPIDADALIEKCGGWYVDECTESGFIGTLENLLATEPTIQPQSTTGQLNDGAQSTARSTDLIDRQAVIDAIEKMNIPEDMCVFEILSHIEVEIATLPTIQPVATDTNVGDTISRQAAIDAVDAIGHIATMPDGDKCIRRSAVKYTLSMLPPAQPEPKEGYWIEGRIYRDVIECNCSECGQLMTTAATVRMNFCPNCGAKMTISK